MRIPALRASQYHGTGGYLTIEELRYQSKITDTFLEASEELGYPVIDINGESQFGFTRTHATLKEGLRCSTAKAFLRPVKRRSNLHISLYSYAMKLLLSKETVTAEGVLFKKLRGQTRIVKAKKEVIISAGSIKSPQVRYIMVQPER